MTAALRNSLASIALILLVSTMTLASDPTPDFHDRFQQDGPVYMATAPNGQMWAVWTYDSGVEQDIAISQAIGETWGLPTLIGRHNRANDLDPRIGFLEDGTPMLVWWQQSTELNASRVVASYLTGQTWTDAAQISPSDVDAGNPNLFTGSGADTSIGYINFDTGAITIVPALKPRPNGGADGPDPMPTIGVTPAPKRLPSRR